jgi:hypothetical protein
MKWIGIILISFLTSCLANTGTKAQSGTELKPPCLWDKGIKKATTTATLQSDPDEKRIQIMEYNKEGRPLTRKNPINGDVIFLYEEKKLKGTIIQDTFNSKDDFNNKIEVDELTEVDTNFVLRNDEFGRPLVMDGTDGNILTFSYTGCEKDYQEYKDANGQLIHQLEMTYENGILLKTVMKSEFEDWSEQVTSYYDYKLNKKRNWVERKYEYPNEMIVIEKRELIYH